MPHSPLVCRLLCVSEGGRGDVFVTLWYYLHLSNKFVFMKNKIIVVLLGLLSLVHTAIQAQSSYNLQPSSQKQQMGQCSQGYDTTDGMLANGKAYNLRFDKRVHRTIDGSTLGSHFAMSVKTLNTSILSAIKEGKLTAYANEKFTNALTYAEVVKSFQPDSITKYDMEEDVYYNKGTKRIVTQIVGIAPIASIKAGTGDATGHDGALWLYYPQCNKLFSGQH